MKQASDTITHSLRISKVTDEKVTKLVASNHVTYTAMINILLSQALQNPQLARPEMDGED